MSGYLVVIKPSARRINRVASEWVGRRGATRRFASKEDARTWADAVSRSGEMVRVQDAAPNDPAPYDGYLVADPVRKRSGQKEPSREKTVQEHLDEDAQAQ